MKQILVIEDDPSICELLTEFLSEEGFEVVCISNALEALKTLNNKRFNLITLDLNLPDTDGNTFLTQLSKSGAAIPVVVVSANPQLLQPNSLVKSVVAKPFNLDTLSAAIHQQLLS